MLCLHLVVSSFPMPAFAVVRLLHACRFPMQLSVVALSLSLKS